MGGQNILVVGGSHMYQVLVGWNFFSCLWWWHEKHNFLRARPTVRGLVKLSIYCMFVDLFHVFLDSPGCRKSKTILCARGCAHKMSIYSTIVDLFHVCMMGWLIFCVRRNYFFVLTVPRVA